MSSDDQTGGLRTDDPTRSADGVSWVTPQLLRETGNGTRDTTPEDVMAEVEATLPTDCDEVAVGEELVTQSLEELLLSLIRLRDDETHGTGLMEDVATLFGVRPSPGTVYPRLHDLDGDGLLARHDLVQTKQYAIDDADAVAERIEAAMYEHLTLGLFLHAALESR